MAPVARPHTFLRSLCLFWLLLLSSLCAWGQDVFGGSAAVSTTGGATYSIPLSLPKGVGDLQPTLSLAYNSQTGNGVCGYGFSVSGLSVITRGMRDDFHDGTLKGIGFDGDDALYLDGRRLLLVSGTDGGHGAVYSPEGEPLTRVTLYYGLDNYYAWFSVETADGMYYQYGLDVGSRQMVPVGAGSARAMAWYVGQVSNALGHHINNMIGQTTRVDYLGGATFSSFENNKDNMGVTIGNYINVWNSESISGDFDEYVAQNPLYMHEYGHTIQSRMTGPSYLFAVGLPSLLSASKNSRMNQPPFSTHHKYWTEKWANSLSSRYFRRYYDVDWEHDTFISQYGEHTYGTIYPTK